MNVNKSIKVVKKLSQIIIKMPNIKIEYKLYLQSKSFLKGRKREGKKWAQFPSSGENRW